MWRAYFDPNELFTELKGSIGEAMHFDEDFGRYYVFLTQSELCPVVGIHLDKLGDHIVTFVYRGRKVLSRQQGLYDTGKATATVLSDKKGECSLEVRSHGRDGIEGAVDLLLQILKGSVESLKTPFPEVGEMVHYDGAND